MKASTKTPKQGVEAIEATNSQNEEQSHTENSVPHGTTTQNAPSEVNGLPSVKRIKK